MKMKHKRIAISTKFFIANIIELKTGKCIFSSVWIIHDCSRVGRVGSLPKDVRCQVGVLDTLSWTVLNQPNLTTKKQRYFPLTYH